MPTGGWTAFEVEGMLLAKGKPFAWGRDIVRVLGEKAKEAGAKLMGDVFVFDILKKDGRGERASGLQRQGGRDVPHRL